MMNSNDITVNETNQNTNENKKKGNLSCFLILLAIIGGIFLIINFFSWLIETNENLAVILLLLIVVILIIIGVKSDIHVRKDIKKRHQEKMQCIYDLDSDAKDYQIRFNNLCMNNKEEFNSNPLGDRHYYKNKILNEFTEQTNDDKLSLIYSANENIGFNKEYSNFDSRYNQILNSTNCVTRDYFKGNVLDIPLKIATLDCYKPKCEPYSLTFCIIDKNTNVNIKTKQLILYRIPVNDDIILNLSKDDFDKYRQNNKANFAYNNELNFITNNDNFNKFFDVYTDDEEKARNFLSDEILEFIAEFRMKYKIGFEIIFKDKIYIQFFTKNIFDIKDMLLDEDNVSAAQYYVITKFIKELVEKLEY